MIVNEPASNKSTVGRNCVTPWLVLAPLPGMPVEVCGRAGHVPSTLRKRSGAAHVERALSNQWWDHRSVWDFSGGIGSNPGPDVPRLAGSTPAPRPPRLRQHSPRAGLSGLRRTETQLDVERLMASMSPGARKPHAKAAANSLPGASNSSNPMA